MWKLELRCHEADEIALTTFGTSVAHAAAEMLQEIEGLYVGLLPAFGEGLQMLFEKYADVDGPCEISNPEMSGEGFDLILSLNATPYDTYPLTPEQKCLIAASPYTWMGGDFVRLGMMLHMVALWCCAQGDEDGIWACHRNNPTAEATNVRKTVVDGIKAEHAAITADQ